MLAAVLAGCGGSGTTSKPPSSGLGRLDSAIAAFDTARGDVLRSTGHIVAAALALDAADQACAAGTTTAASAARAKARATVPRARTALAALPMRLRRYQTALAALAAAEKAATDLSPDQRTALTAVVTGGRAEDAASDTFRVAAKTAWPSYENLDASESTWLDRRLAGWYRDVPEAAAAYTVLVQDDRPALQRARTLLQRVDAARRPVSERERTALATADAALAPLRSPG